MVSFTTVLCSDVWNVVCDVMIFSVLANVERTKMGMYEVPKLFLFGFGMGVVLASFHMCRIILVLKKMCSRGPRCFRCLIKPC